MLPVRAKVMHTSDCSDRRNGGLCEGPIRSVHELEGRDVSFLPRQLTSDLSTRRTPPECCVGLDPPQKTKERRGLAESGPGGARISNSAMSFVGRGVLGFLVNGTLSDRLHACTWAGDRSQKHSLERETLSFLFFERHAAIY